MTRPHQMLASAATLMMIAAPLAARAQDPHAGHHPANTASTPAATATPGTTTPSTTPMGGQSGMMGGSGMAMGGMMGGDMSMSQHIDEHLGRVRGELGITPAQAAVWTAYADALRASAANMDHARQTMMAPPAGGARLSPVDQLDRHDRMLASMRDDLRRLRPALAQLYAALSPEQKQKADSLLVPHGSMMARMPAGGMIGQ
ncbi:Spy/CpxP family protein refolding chaperone [Sphingopyxis indica]|uniref:Spy/CpxP family protein refolding chaperone n=1 Tax=Sphingopyxis indica TaxID=436663 RepID=UPI002938D9E1|nr:Spy/CpxP family protein refolding chaperone [Sphingopyxis indica]WOF44973.1 Spy/CpxP family protein refolding chaperone [Sphingopyxis indica]